MHDQSITIPLTKGYEAIIDAADYPLVASRKWHALPMSDYHIYAVAYIPRAETPAEERRGRGGTTLAMHRLLLNAPKGAIVDHINGNTLDNRRSNIRIADRRTNELNQHKVSVWLSNEETERLRRLVELLHVKEAGVIREAIRLYAQQHGVE